MVTPPKIGDDIYVPTSLYIGHGEDDVQGGLGQVRLVEEGISAGQPVYYIGVIEHPGVKYNWDNLYSEQEKLKARFGNKRAHPDPDY